MIETLVQGNDWLTWIEQFDRGERTQTFKSAAAPLESHESQGEAWDQTDRLLHFPARNRTPTSDWQRHRARWLQEHDVRTEFLDAGIGTCWFAQQGEDEPVCGETEEAAIAHLARQNGLPWHDQ
jgi:hypothetical protein